MADIVMMGEGMIELSRAGDGAWRLGHGGDTLNTAIHLARLGDHAGDRLHSATIRSARSFGPLGGRGTGYRPGADRSGREPRPLRHHHRCRGRARLHLLAQRQRRPADLRRRRDRGGLRAGGGGADLLGFSLISLAILPDDGRAALLDLAARVRANGGAVAFDGNYRPRLGAEHERSATLARPAVATATIGLPTREDEAMMGDAGDAAAVAGRWRSLGAVK
ncbi:hypothetical protein AB5I41_07270 [Sphingomonas sp. MMS24-JH45]